MATTFARPSVHSWRILSGLVLLFAVSRYAHALEKASEQVSPFYGSLSRGSAIEVPPFHGLEPKLAFSYSSEGRNGFLGVGWNLSGISTIDRVNPGLGTPTWDDTKDVYLLDGQQLIPCVGIVSPSCTAGGSHATQDESYLKILHSSNTWTVWGRDGTRTIFSPTLQPAAGHTLRWGQTSTIDTKGNTVTTTWAQQGGDVYPDVISYNGYSVSFIRESRPDTLSFAAGDNLGKTLYRLRSVFVNVGSTPIRAYRLLYSTSPLTGRSLLTSIEQFGKDVLVPGAVPLPAQMFSYQDDTLGRGFYPIWGDPPSPPGTIENVVWTNLVNAQATGNDLIKSGNVPAWDAGASSTRAIMGGDGYLQITTSIGGNKMIGLSNGDNDASNGDIDFALYENAGDLWVSENGTLYGPLGHPLINGEPLRVEIQEGGLFYKQNGVIVRQSQRKIVYPLLVDASIWSAGQSIVGAVLSGSLQNTTHWCGHVLSTADVNGDGRTDQICVNGVEGTAKVALATASGFATATTWLSGIESSDFTVADVNSDGKADFITYLGDSGQFKVALSSSDGTNFSPPVLWGTANPVWYQGSPHDCRTAGGRIVTIGAGDFNGDGVTDVSCKVLGYPEAFIGLSTGSSFSFSIFAQLSCEPYERTGAIDFDGDGKDDWYCIGVTTGSLLVFPSTGTSFVYPAFGSLNSSFCVDPYYVLGDFNGDGRTDAACTFNGKTALSTGSHFEVQSPSSTGWCAGVGTVAFASDVDGDGASEIVCNNSGAPPNDIEVRKWIADAWGPVETWKAAWCNATVHAGDFNGDGKTDLLCSALSAPVVAGTGGLRVDLLGTAGNGLGGTMQVSYSSSVNFPNTNNPPPKQVVTLLTSLDGLGGSSTTRYAYAGGFMDRHERRFLGFHEVIKTLPCLAGQEFCPSVRTVLKQDLSSAGKPESVERRDGEGHVLLKSEYSYAVTTTLPRTSQLAEEWSYTYDLLGAYKRTRATHQYDAYGNRTQTILYGDADASGDEKTTAWGFVPNTLAPTFIVNRVSSEQQFAGAGTGGLKLTERRYSYDGLGWGTPPTHGFATRIENWLDTEARFVDRTLHYDPWGNLDSVQDETDRTTAIGYDTTYHVYQTSTTNGAGETETTSWDAQCSVPSQRLDANQAATRFDVDNFCRPSETTYPLVGSSSGFERRTYVSLGDPAAQHVRLETPSATPGDGSGDDYVLEYFDGAGRTYKTIKKGTPTRPTIRKDTAYNTRGGTASETTPYYEGFETPRTTTHSYDALDRLTASVFPDSNHIQKTYGIWSETTFDEHLHPATTRFDAYGRTAQTQQVLGGQTLSTMYSYDLLGRMTGITDPVGITWSWSFDSLGRNPTRTDPDSGTWTFTYDDGGRVLHQTDAKGQLTVFAYDLAGRLSTKTNSVETVTTGYSEPRPGYFNIGRTTSVSVPGRTLAVDYDAAGRAVRWTRTLDGNTYVAERRYDSAGRLRGTTYPDGEAIGTEANPLSYDRAGRLQSIPGILNAVEYDGAGRPTSQTAADAVPNTVTTKAYSTRGFLTDIVTTKSGVTIQNLHYQLDPAGLVDWVTSPFANEGWDYTYDELHRLVNAESLWDTSQNQSFQYDSIGRMTNNSRVGIYSYLPNGWGHSHAPETVNEALYSYDLNGNTFSGGGRTFQWNPDNLVSQVAKNTVTTSFTYDGLGERVKKTTTNPNSTSIYPFGDDYEVTDGIITKYVNVDGLGVIAKKVGPDTFWIETDRLGSIQAVTDVGGTIVQRRSYRPYGDKIADMASHVESRGYVDQRKDSGTDLTYLHARYYDSQLGLFVSPDPLPPVKPGVGLNRYAYVFGNPVNRSDRSGLEDPLACHPALGEGGDCGAGGGWGAVWGDLYFIPGGGIGFSTGNRALDELGSLYERWRRERTSTVTVDADGDGKPELTQVVTRHADGTVTVGPIVGPEVARVTVSDLYTDAEHADVQALLDTLLTTEYGQRILKPIIDDVRRNLLIEPDALDDPRYSMRTDTIYLDPRGQHIVDTLNGSQMAAPIVILGHELGHASMYPNNLVLSYSEGRTINLFENPLRLELGFPLRGGY